MTEIDSLFILQNQDKLFLSKTKEWVDGTDLTAVFRTPHKDEALNQLVEINSKDVSQRIRLVECAAKGHGQLTIDPDIMPEPLPKPEPTEQLTLMDDSVEQDLGRQHSVEQREHELVNAD